MDMDGELGTSTADLVFDLRDWLKDLLCGLRKTAVEQWDPRQRAAARLGVFTEASSFEVSKQVLRRMSSCRAWPVELCELSRPNKRVNLIGWLVVVLGESVANVGRGEREARKGWCKFGGRLL